MEIELKPNILRSCSEGIEGDSGKNQSTAQHKRQYKNFMKILNSNHNIFHK